MVTCKLVKRKGMNAAPKKMSAVGDPAPSSYVLTDNEDGTLIISGENKAHDPLDISSVATLSASSSDQSLATCSVSGMVVSVNALKVGSPKVTIVATWNDGSVGPFTIDVPLSISADSTVSGLAVNFGTPTVRP